MGLLDFLNNRDGVFALGLLDAAAAKPVRTSFGGGLLSAMGQADAWQQQQEARRQQQAEQLLKAQLMGAQLQHLAAQTDETKAQVLQRQDAMAKAKAQEALDAQFRGLIPSPKMDAVMGALAGGGGPTQANAAKVPAIDPMQQLQFEAMRLGQIKPTDYLASMRKDATPMKLGADETLIDPRTFKTLVTNPKPQAPDEFSRMLSAAGLDPNSPQAQSLALQRLQKMSTHQPATNVNVNTEKPLMNSIASKLGDQIDASLAQARAATQAISTAQTIKSAVDTGKVVAGPGASFRVAGLQIGQTLGIGGKDAAEVLGNTRTVIQSMAKAELDAAQQMKGQGQITEAERDIIRRAASGNIDSLTTGEVRLLADTMEKTARYKIAAHKANVSNLSKMPNAAPILPFYQVEDPGQYQPSAQQAPRVRRFNPATGKLED